MKRRAKGLSIVLVPEEGGESRTFRLSALGLRLAIVFAVIAVVGSVAMATSWWYMAFQAGRTWRLEAMVDSLQAERSQILALAEELARVEAEYEHIRSLFGLSETPASSNLWLPPAGIPRSSGGEASVPASLGTPTSWPLTEAGSVTQVFVEADPGEHPGLDIAIPTDSYIRASGAGRVVRMGEDPIYGLFLVLEHGEGYQTVYAHASAILVNRGQTVRRNEVIALSGSTGRSTAAHLHFEILLDGNPVDPLSMVQQPS